MTATTQNTIEALAVGTTVYTTATVGRGASVHIHRAEVTERHGRKSLTLVGHAECAQPNIRSGATRVSGEVTCKRCLSYANRPSVI